MKRLDMSEAEILAIANPIMDNLMQASTDIDHERHVRDFTEQLKAIVTQENLEAQRKEYQAKLGNFSEREFVAVYRKKRTLPSSENKSIKSPRAHRVSSSHQHQGEKFGAKRVCNFTRANQGINSGSEKRRLHHVAFHCRLL